MMGKGTKWVTSLPDDRRQWVGATINVISNLVGLITVLALVGNVVAFNLPASLHCKGTRNYTVAEQASSQPTYAILGNGSPASSNSELHLTSTYETDFCQSDYYVCSARPVGCDDSVLSEVFRDRITLSSFTALRSSQSVSYLTQEVLTVLWGCLHNIGIFLWFTVNVPAPLSAAAWMLLSFLTAMASAPIEEALRIAQAAKTELLLRPPPPLSQIGRESALGDASIASASQVAAALTRQPSDFANDMIFDD